MSWNIPPLDPIEFAERKHPPKVPETFELVPINLMEAPSPVPVTMTGVVSFYDFTDKRTIESLDAHAEEVNIYFCLFLSMFNCSS